jgi:hypothetical protein
MLAKNVLILLKTGLVLGLLSCNGGLTDASNPNLPSMPEPPTAAPPAPSPPGIAKKLLEFGWDNPRSDFVRQNIAQMQKRPFSGFTMLFGVGTNIFNKTAFSETDFAADRANLKATAFGSLTDNFFRMDTRHEEGWSWLSDADWNASLENVRQTTRTAKVGGFKGFFFDTEPYGPNPWDYSTAEYGGKSLEEVSKIVRARGRDFMRVVHQELPAAKIITLWAQSVINRQIGASGTITDSSWPLYIPFLEGWMDVAQGETFIDGNENAYFNLLEEDFNVERADFNDAIRLFSAENQRQYKKLTSFANSLSIDTHLNTYNSPRYFGFFAPSDADRLKLLESNIYLGLKTSDEYVWVYSEQMNWWTGALPVGAEAAIRSGATKFNAGQPLGFDITKMAGTTKQNFLDRIFIRGRITKAGKGLYGSATIESGIKDKQGKETACVIYNALGDYDCEFPYGWKGTLTPTLNGERFDPPTRDYNQYTSGPGAWLENQDFTAK